MIGLGLGLGFSSPSAVASSPPDPYGPELVVDGDFAIDPGPWMLEDGDNPATISGGKLLGSGSGASLAFQGGIITPTGTFQIVFTIGALSVGNVTLATSTAPCTPRSLPGTYSENVAGTAGDDLVINMDGAAIVDDVSVRQVL